MNTTQEYVASTTLEPPEWQNTTVLQGDVRQAIPGLKHADGKNLSVNGSGQPHVIAAGWGLLDAATSIAPSDPAFENDEGCSEPADSSALGPTSDCKTASFFLMAG